MKATRDAVIQAIATLTEAGVPPTVAAVRRTIGGGSFTTIQAHMLDLRDLERATQTPESDTPLPSDLEVGMARFTQGLWARACAMARARLADERAALEAAGVRQESARQEAVALADQISIDLDLAEAGKADVERVLADAQQALIEVKRELAVAHARLLDMEPQLHAARAAERAALTETAELRGRLEALSPAAPRARRASRQDGGTKSEDVMRPE